MFKQLKNEAMITFEIKVDSPLVILSGEKNLLDPSIPEDQVIKQNRNGILEPVIPGSSLKGVFRSRAERLLSSMGYKIDNPFDCKSPSNQAEGTAEQCYQQSCLASKLFGSLQLKSRVSFSDGYIKDGTEFKMGIRHGVGINRITGGLQNKAKFDYEVVEDGVFTSTITLTNFELWQLNLLLWLIKEMDEGYIKLGSSTSRGFGKVQVPHVSVKLLSYMEQNEEDVIKGFYDSNDRTQKVVQWKKDFIGYCFEDESLDHWIGENGYLSGVKMPSVP